MTREIRSYNPQAVRYEHLRAITFLYGDDRAGMDIRFERFAELLSEHASDAMVFQNIEDALGNIVSGNMFSEDVFIAVKDISPILKSSSEAKKQLAELMAALETYADTDSKFVFCAAVARSSQLSQFIDFVQRNNGLAREVSVPSARAMVEWALEYAKSIGRPLEEIDARKLVKACDGDPSVMGVLLDNVSESFSLFSDEELKVWANGTEDIMPYDMKKALASFNVPELIRFRQSMPLTTAGYRLFLIKLRFIMPEMMSNGLRSASGNFYRSRLVKMYELVNDELEALSGGKGEPSELRFFSQLSSISNS